MTPRGASLALCGFYFLFYGFYGVTIPYLPVWLASRGLDPALVGVVIAAAFLPKVISAPVFAHVADTWGKHRVLIQLLLFATLFSLVLFFYAQTDAWFFSLTMAVNFFAPAILPLMDRAALAQRRRDGASSYTTIRLCGSVGFAVFSLLCGLLLDFTGADGVIWLGAALTLACMALGRLLPLDVVRASGTSTNVPGTTPDTTATATPGATSDTTATATAGTTPGTTAGSATAGTATSSASSATRPTRKRAPLARILADSPVFWCIVASALVQASNGYLYSYASLYWLAQGLGTAQIGLLWTVGIAAEIILFMLARQVLARVSPVNLILFSAAMTAVRWAGLAWVVDPFAMAAFQLLQAFTLAGNNMAIMAFLAARVDDQARTTAIALYTMLSAGLFMFLAINLVNMLGVSQSGWGFGVMAACAALALPLVLWSRRRAELDSRIP